MAVVRVLTWILFSRHPLMAVVRLANLDMSIRRRTELFAMGFGILAAIASTIVLLRQFPASPHSNVANWEYLTRNVELCTKHNDLGTMKSLPQLILFMDNVNAIQGVESRVVMRELVESVRQGPQSGEIAFRRVVIDLDESEEILDAIGIWLSDQDEQDYVQVVYSGYGAILWVRNGKVVDYVNYAHDAGIADVLSRTHRAFSVTAEVN
jgi:hypothetical protein